MTPKEKAKRYDKALERARIWQNHLYDTNDRDYADELNYIFPELKENEDEKMKESCKFFLNLQKINSPHSISDIDKCIAWLEKQGEQKSANIIPIPDGCHTYIKDRKVYIENYTKTTSTNKVKSKFKVGDWVVDERCGLVTQVEFLEEDGYEFPNGGWVSYENADKYFHLWSIQDAKDGDVLATDKSVFIYAKVLYGKPYAYCGVDKFGVFKDNCLENNWSNSVDNIHPATKEQRDFLFQKMKEEGYAFDFEKKELKKLGQPEVTKTSDQEEIAEIPFGAKDSELQEATYFIPKGFHAEIDGDKIIIKKGEKPTAWSEEDEKLLYLTVDNLEEIMSRYGELYGLVGKCITWLKSLKQRIGG